jgi:hypothetical protein
MNQIGKDRFIRVDSDIEPLNTKEEKIVPDNAGQYMVLSEQLCSLYKECASPDLSNKIICEDKEDMKSSKLSCRDSSKQARTLLR